LPAHHSVGVLDVGDLEVVVRRVLEDGSCQHVRDVDAGKVHQPRADAVGTESDLGHSDVSLHAKIDGGARDHAELVRLDDVTHVIGLRRDRKGPLADWSIMVVPFMPATLWPFAFTTYVALAAIGEAAAIVAPARPLVRPTPTSAILTDFIENSFHIVDIADECRRTTERQRTCCNLEVDTCAVPHGEYVSRDDVALRVFITPSRDVFRACTYWLVGL
jgi:hypothetical protein